MKFSMENGLVDAGGRLRVDTDELAAMIDERGPGRENLVRTMKVHLAVFQFVDHDFGFWKKEVLDNKVLSNDFLKFTRYRNKFLKSFAEGDLVTLQSLDTISAWLKQAFPKRPAHSVHFANGESGKRKAASRETVKEEAGAPS